MSSETKHPLAAIMGFCSSHPEIKQIEFSIYKYQPQTVADTRIIVPCEARRMRSTFYRLRKNLDKDQEVAFHSRVYVKTWKSWYRPQIFHIPMIDFSNEVTLADLAQLESVLQDFNCDKAFLFSSGRSYHLYGLTLLTPDTWVNFMGRILLLNLPSNHNLVDCRWVGHRLMAGYASLRWTKNTKHYKSSPRLAHSFFYTAVENLKMVSDTVTAPPRTTVRVPKEKTEHRDSPPHEKERELVEA